MSARSYVVLTAARVLRRSCRQDGQVRNETLANLSRLPGPAIDAIGAVLDG
ncbi:MAG TPA: hypothetical protein VIJ82_03275 [Streptosporangiaceae bacterium]